MNFAWLSRGGPLLGSPVPIYPTGDRIFPEYWPNAEQRGQQCLALPWRTASWGQNYVYQRGNPLVLYPRFLHTANFPRVLIPRARYPQEPSTIHTRPRLWTFHRSPFAFRCWVGVRTTFSHVAIPSSRSSDISINRIFPEYWPRGPSIHRTFYNPNTAPSLKFAWLSRGVPLLVGSKLRFPRLVPKVSRSKEFSPNNDHAGPVPTGTFYNPHPVPFLNFSWLACDVPLLGVRTMLSTWRSSSYRRFLDKMNLPRILTLRARYPQDASTIQTPSRPWIFLALPLRTAARCGQNYV